MIFSLAITVFILWLAEATGDTTYTNFTVYFKEHSLDGLQADSDVTMKGIKVGSVQDFYISPKDIEQIKVTLKLQEDTPVKVDTRAVIRRNLLTGLANIDLIHSSTESAPLTEVPEDEDYPVILEGRTELSAIADNLPAVIEDVSEAIHQASAFFTEENRAKFQAILSNVEKATQALSKNDQELQQLIPNINGVTKDLKEMSKSVTKLSENTNAQLETITTELVGILNQVKATTANLDKQVTELSASLSNTAQVLSVETANAKQDLSVAAQNAARTFERYDNPKRLLLGPNEGNLGPGERGGQ